MLLSYALSVSVERTAGSENRLCGVVTNGGLIVVRHVDIGVAGQVTRIGISLAVVPLQHTSRLAIGVKSIARIEVAPVSVLVHTLVLTDVVGLRIRRQASVVGEVRSEYLAHVRIIRATAQVYVRHPRGFILLLNREVHHGRLVRVKFTAKLLLLIRLLVQLHVLHGIRRHIRHRRLHIAEEGFAIHEHLTHRLAVKCYVAVFVHRNARQLTHQCGERSTRRKAQGFCVEHQGIFFYGHHSCERRDLCFVQLIVGGGEFQLPQIHGRVLFRQFNAANERVESRQRNVYHQLASVSLDGKFPFVVCGHLPQFNGITHDFIGLRIDHFNGVGGL